MEPLQIISYQAGVRRRGDLGSALPGAPRVPDAVPPDRLRVRLACLLRRLADRLAPPELEVHPIRPPGPRWLAAELFGARRYDR